MICLKKNGILGLCIFLFSSSLPAMAYSGFSAGNDEDSTAEKVRRFEFALNITNAISRFSGNGPRNVNEDPYLVALKYKSRNENRAWRLGVNQFYNASRSELNSINRTTSDMYFSPLIGHEWRVHLDHGFMFFYGLDARASIRKEEVNTSGFAGNDVIASTEKAIGAGPLCGFGWKINKRLILYTEANYYVNYRTVYRTYTSPGGFTLLEDSEKYMLTPVVPTSIFLVVNF
jgi:hypothetical protein